MEEHLERGFEALKSWLELDFLKLEFVD